MQNHLVTDGDIGDRIADGVYPAGILVADGVWQRDARFLRPLPLQNMDVGSADAGTPDPHDHVEWTLDLGFGDVGQLQLGVVSDDLYGFHRGLLLSTNCGVTVLFPSAPPL